MNLSMSSNSFFWVTRPCAIRGCTVLLSPNRVRIDLITICKLAETSKTYSYHSGRHSFASLITLEAGVPMETICKMLGHKDVKMTQRYARVTLSAQTPFPLSAR